jgi:hypothetical protein
MFLILRAAMRLFLFAQIYIHRSPATLRIASHCPASVVGHKTHNGSGISHRNSIRPFPMCLCFLYVCFLKKFRRGDADMSVGIFKACSHCGSHAVVSAGLIPCNKIFQEHVNKEANLFFSSLKECRN